MARLPKVFATDDPTGKLKAFWAVNEQPRDDLRAVSLEDAGLDKETFQQLVQDSTHPETGRLWQSVPTAVNHAKQ